jgi:hypothetical protein
MRQIAPTTRGAANSTLVASRSSPSASWQSARSRAYFATFSNDVSAFSAGWSRQYSTKYYDERTR